MKSLTDEALEELALEFQPPEYEAGQSPYDKYLAGWRPRMETTQARAYNNRRAIYFLFYGGRGSGKTCLALDMLVEHCFLNMNAVAFVIVREVGQSKDGGAWDKLVNFTLPRWKSGNRNPKTGESYDNGIDLYFEQPRYDPETKKPFIWIGNRYGGGSKIISFSLPIGAHVEDKIKGREASFILVDEAQTCEGNAYFYWVIQQVGRKHDIEGTQPVIYCCNPEGPSHWLYPIFHPFNPDTGARVDEESGEADEDYATYHVPIQENINNLPDGYYDRVQTGCRGNPIFYKRLLLGEWIDMPTGEAMFAEVFSRSRHVRGDLTKLIGLGPVKGHPIILGYDLGPAHSSIHFMQMLPTIDKLVWLVFDELNYVGLYMPYQRIVPQILKRMDYWQEMARCKFEWEHISDNSAFNQVRTDGSYDAAEIEQLSDGRIGLKEAPKGQGSVPGRMRMLMEMFAQDEIIISAMCPKTIDMCEYMQGQKPTKDQYNPDGALTPSKTSPHRHVADSVTYPMWYYRVGSGHRRLESTQTESRIVRFGQRD